ncbi:MAG TPA: XRE family transcriptional regulator [Polyangiaceae bacterium]|nr:XRE family transcriptional regulator [Polyangiaceae bacterium]
MVSSQQLGERLSDARKRAKLTQAQVAERLGFARTTLVAIEKGERRPSNAELVRLAEVLGVSVNDLLRDVYVRGEVSPRFRLAHGADRNGGAIAEAVERLRTLGARYAELEHLLGLRRVPARLEALQTYRVDEASEGMVDPHLAGEDAARAVRGLLGLGDEPALELDERFETEAGLRIFYLDRLPPAVSAFFIWGDDIGACVAVKREHPVEKQRWSLTHELGHFLRDREGGDVFDEPASPKQAGEVFPDSFTKEFLMPSGAVQKRFADRCRAGKFTPVDLYGLSRTFGVSFQAMALRLEELRLLPRGSYQKILQSHLQPQALARREGVGPTPNPPSRDRHLPERYETLAVAAYDQELLSEGEFAEYLETDVASARVVYQRRRQIPLEDGTKLAVDFAAGDLRSA